jgi:hypothetical protein
MVPSGLGGGKIAIGQHFEITDAELRDMRTLAQFQHDPFAT